MRRRGQALLALLVLAAAPWLLPAAAAHADGPTSADARAIRIERSLACPQCTDLPLDVCDNDICKDMRTIIRQKIAAGESDQAIRQYFVDRYGARVLLAPPKNQGTLAVWLIPFAGLAAGSIALYLFLRAAHARRRHAAPSVLGAAALEQYRGAIERELQQYE